MRANSVFKNIYLVVLAATTLLFALFLFDPLLDVKRYFISVLMFIGPATYVYFNRAVVFEGATGQVLCNTWALIFVCLMALWFIYNGPLLDSSNLLGVPGFVYTIYIVGQSLPLCMYLLYKRNFAKKEQ